MHDGYWIRFAVLHMREKGNYAFKEPFVLNHTIIFPKKISTMPMTFSLIFMLNPLFLQSYDKPRKSNVKHDPCSERHPFGADLEGE